MPNYIHPEERTYIGSQCAGISGKRRDEEIWGVKGETAEVGSALRHQTAQHSGQFQGSHNDGSTETSIITAFMSCF